MGEGREKRTCIEEERAINKIDLIILNILEKLSRLIIPNRGSICFQQLVKEFSEFDTRRSF
jgi:hypothetical protein